MIVDGRATRDEIGEELRTKGRAGLLRSPSLLVLRVGDDPATVSFVRQKRLFASRIGAGFEEKVFPATISTEDLVREIQTATADGVVVQLPLPASIDTARVLAALPPSKDVDAIGLRPIVMPPVAGAVEEILRRNDIDVRGMKALVVGKGKLVGIPVGLWLETEGAKVSYADASTPDISKPTFEADIIISGAGSPGLITPSMVKEGVVLVDAGTSEAAGKMAGDCDPRCAEKAALFTPVPGGVGPVTVAILFKNLFELAHAA